MGSDVREMLTDSLRRTSYLYFPSENPDHVAAWNITERLIREIADICTERQISLFVFNVSTPVQVYPDVELRRDLRRQFEISDLFHSELRLQEFCDGAGIPFFPLASRLRTIVEGGPVFLHGFENTQMGTGHWNETGHRAAAELISQWLQEQLWATGKGHERVQ